ncbi:hypothetical protein J0K78_04980 [Halobacillus sp. GSS1]|uniref:hypothetical protein n=1 Tax=Halobacillus sp. GSS1 TaxID=2815919 RepID=UPI001A909C2A|nr:hypothetical protein [Halobacillus sp. GSS1]MBN9653614.1 hypothetical protein [Halobacillus sp. GSS1]
MAKKDFKQKFNEMMGRYSNNEKKYEDAHEAKQQEIIDIQTDIQEKESHVSALHKMKALGDVSEDAYKVEKDELDRLKEKKDQLHEDMELMVKYKTDDAKAIVEAMEEEQAEHAEEKRQEYEEVKAEILQAKLQYLESLQQLSQRYKEYKKPSSKIGRLKEQLGIKKDSYVGDTYSEIGQVFAGTEPIAVEVLNGEAHEVMQFGNINSHLRSAVKQKQEQGFLK